MIILTEEKSARALTLKFGTNNLSELPRVVFTLLRVKSLCGECQQNREVFHNTLANANVLVDEEVLIVTFSEVPVVLAVTIRATEF